MDAKGDLAAALGSAPVGFEPRVVQTNISVIALHPEDSLREYLKVFFKVPRVLSLTPLSRMYDFVATSVPGPKDMLVVGKIAYEERRTLSDGSPAWDIIIVDCTATGRALAQILASREMRRLTRGGMIRSQLEWIDAVMTDARRTALLITSLPEEMPVVEAVELYQQARAARYVAVAGCVVNRTSPLELGPDETHVLGVLRRGDHAELLEKRSNGGIGPFLDGIAIAEQFAARGRAEIAVLRKAVDCPVAEVPLQSVRAGLATTRGVAHALEAAG